MGGGNGTAMPYYLMNTAFNMIELVDNESGKTIGNALCFFEKDKNGKALITDEASSLLILKLIIPKNLLIKWVCNLGMQ